MIKTFLRTFLILSLTINLFACQFVSPAAESPSGNQGPVIIGASLPLTGRFGDAGTAAKNGYQVWSDLINKSGGLLGRQVELKILDNTSEQDIASADYEKLITQDKVDLVFGTFSSFLVIPTSEVASKHGYAFIEPAGGAPDVFNRGLANLFFAQPAQSARQADPFALYLLALPSNQRPKTFATVSLDDPFTLGVIERLAGLLKDGGLNLVYETTYPEGTTDYSSIASDIATINPDLFLGGTQTEDCIAQIQAYQAQGYQPYIAYFTNGPTLPGPFRQALGTATEGIFSSISWFPDSLENQNSEFTSRYIEMFGGSLGDIPEDAANAFTVGQVLQQAVNNVGTIDNKALIEELHRGNYDTVVGPLSFDETGAPQGSYMLLQWQGENFVIVGPADRAEVDPKSPPKPAW
jgi:branched-chain amino acid transport system substrate-binding protein